MTDTHQDFAVKSNARRTAKRLGLDPNSVNTIIKAGAKIYRLQLDQPKQTLTTAINEATRKTIAKQEKKKAAKPKKAAKAKKNPRNPSGANGKVGGKFEQVAAMLRQDGGAAMSAITKATGWLAHTARARISVNVSKLLGKGEIIQRTRPEKGGESHYAIVKSKQQDLPL